jgi:hypothetical protein
LGNLTLLEPKLNREAANKSFEQKIEIYKNSEYEMTREIADRWSSFGMDQISVRLREFSELATAVWRTDY